MGLYIVGFLQAIQLESDWTWMATTRQLMAMISILRMLLAIEATGINDEYAKVHENELGQLSRESIGTAAVRRGEWGRERVGLESIGEETGGSTGGQSWEHE
ncbi:MAG: hypothetical protein EZS28_030842 [Streblomastix strix]|uniref:Uncharacterized protein n=1 Tax=Streblomastix strix TaxID=222440 RepID=A0A5J4UUN0_9EUKA|nr:MAG: hypothetical protein EZS28_030842 [Streblomastix strix]